MSTPDLNSVNAEPQFASVSGLAAMLGVDKAAVSRRVARLEGQGLVETRAGGAGKAKLVNVASYLAATEQTADAVRAANSARARAPDAATDKSLTYEQTRGAAIRADLAQIELDKARGELVPAKDVADAMARAAGKLVRGLDALIARSDDFAAAVARDGAHGCRLMMREAVRELREKLAASMRLLATETDGDGEE